MSYFFNLFKTGAVRKTPKKVIERIIGEIKPKDNIRIIEIGAGRGEITRQIVKKLEGFENPTYYAFEIDPEFAGILETNFPSIHVKTADAFHFDSSISPGFKADYVISSLPLSFYPKSKRAELYSHMKSRLAENGRILILFHAWWIYGEMKKEIGSARLVRFMTLPPYFLLVSE